MLTGNSRPHLNENNIISSQFVVAKSPETAMTNIDNTTLRAVLWYQTNRSKKNTKEKKKQKNNIRITNATHNAERRARAHYNRYLHVPTVICRRIYCLLHRTIAIFYEIILRYAMRYKLVLHCGSSVQCWCWYSYSTIRIRICIRTWVQYPVCHLWWTDEYF